MSIRRDPIYISSEVWRALHLICKSMNVPDAPKKITPDEIADNWLSERLTEKYPQFALHQKQVDKMEKELIASLQKK